MSNNVQQEFQATAASEQSVAEVTALTQISPQYGLQNVATFVDTGGSGSVSAADSKFICQSGTAATGAASINSARELTFRPGQGVVARISASFSPGAANSRQSAGLVNTENNLSFGFLGATFGIIHAHDGKVENQELTITTPAAGSETATITVDGAAFSVPLTAGTVQHNAIEIAASLTSQVLDYRFSSNNDQVVALAIIPEAAGSFAFSSATAVAAWVQIAAGNTFTIEPIIEQTSWNLDTMSDFTFDLTKLNSFQIKYSFSGALFSVFDDTGLLRNVHFISGVNNSVDPFLTTLSFRVGWISSNVGNTTNLTVSGSSASGFIEGQKRFDSGIQAENASALSIGTSNTTVLVVRNRISFGNRTNRAELLPRFISLATQTNKTAFFEFLVNPSFSSDLIFNYLDKAESIAEFSEDNVLVTGGKLIGSVTVTLGSPESIVFNEDPHIDTFLATGSVFAIVARVSSGAAADMDVSMSWQEDI